MSHFYHKKSLGQNFLNNKKILEKISKIKNLRNEYVVEIGPGKGSLTEFLLKEKPRVLTVIEKDKKLKPFLEKIKIKHPKNFNLIFEDALNFNFSTLTNKKIILVSNLPYNIATTLIINWIKNPHIYNRLVLNSRIHYDKNGNWNQLISNLISDTEKILKTSYNL